MKIVMAYTSMMRRERTIISYQPPGDHETALIRPIYLGLWRSMNFSTAC